MANAVTASGEEGDPTSRYQNPRYSGKGVPDRGNNPKRKGIYDWEIHGKYDGGWERVHTADSRTDANRELKNYYSNEPKTQFKLKSKRKDK
jgi:hypothetical protein